MTKKKIKISFRTVLSIITLILVIYVVWKNWADIQQAIGYLGQMNIFVLLLLIPEQFLMYYACGQMFFSYLMAKRSDLKISRWKLMRISFELNFVNNAIPAGGFGGLGYIAWRLKEFGATPGQSSFMYALRYMITILANQVQTLIAVAFLLGLGMVPESGMGIIALVIVLGVVFIGAIIGLIAIASSKERVERFADFIVRVCNGFVVKITAGRKRQVLRRDEVWQFMMDIHADLVVARRNKKILIKPILWGILHSFLEVATYWIVAISVGRVDILPQIMVGEAIGSVMGAIVPYGLYELGMTGVMAQLGVELSVASLVVLVTRVIVLGSTILSGYGFYQNAIIKIGREEEGNMRNKEK